MKKKILFCLPGFNYGGTVFSTLNMISFLIKDYDVYVLPMTYQGPVIEKYREAGVKLLPESHLLSAMMGRLEKESGSKNKSISFAQKALRKIFKKIGYNYEQFLFEQVAHQLEKKYKFDYVASCQEGGSTYFASCFKNSKKIAWFRSEYSVYQKQLSIKEQEFEKKIYQEFDRIVCVSKITCDDFVNWIPDVKAKTVAIHNIQFTEKILKSTELSVTDNFDPNVFSIVSVGRFAPQKRFSSIPQIAKEIADTGLKFKWYIIGDGNMAGEYDKTKDEIEKLNVGNYVSCIGSRINPYPYIKQANLLVCPSYYEACPRVVIESKIIHTPVVCADFSSAKEFIINGVDGYIDDLDKLSNIISTLIRDKNLYQNIQNECNKYAIDNKVIYNKLLNVFS